jgi:hypothetical protein
MDKAALALGGTTFVVAGVAGGVLTWYWEDALFASVKRRKIFAVTMGAVSAVGTVYLMTRLGGLKIS